MPKRRHDYDQSGNRITLIDGPDAPLFTVAPCARCQTPCMVRWQPPQRHSGITVLQPARTAYGMCAPCAVHWWLFSVDAFKWSFANGPGALCLPVTQRLIESVLHEMHPELAALDWQRLIDQWALSWPDDWRLPKDG